MVKFALLRSKSIAETIQVASLLALSVYLILPYAAVSIILAVFVLSSLFLNLNNTVNRKALFLQISFYLLLMCSLVYSKNTAAGLGEFKGNISLLVFPVLLLLFHNTWMKKIYKYMLLLYVMANLGLIVVLFNFFSNGIITDRFPNLIEEGLIPQLKYLWSYPFEFVLSKSLKGSSSWFMNHKTILALNFLLASLFSLKLFFVDCKTSKLKYLLLFPLAFLVPAIIYTQALVNIALLPLLLIYVLIYLKTTLYKIVFVLLIVILSALAFVQLDLKETFNNGNTDSVINLYHGLLDGEISEDADPRLFIYHCSMDLIKSNPVFGYGVGDVQDQLNNCYASNNFEAKIKKERIFNSHNFYAHLMLGGGMFALLLFLFLLGYNGKLAFVNKDYAFLIFLVIFTVNLLFDNIILRFQGALCFSFFNALFLWKNLNVREWEVQ